MIICAKCNAENNDAAKFCTECGAALIAEQKAETVETVEAEAVEVTPVETTYSYGTDNNYKEKDQYTYTYDSKNTTGIAPRNMVVALILTFVTCGLYGIYWMIKLNDEVNTLAGETNATSGVMVFVLSLVTCGIYSFIWMFKMGERCDRIKGNNGGNLNILFLILTFLGLGIVSYCLIQDTINHNV